MSIFLRYGSMFLLASIVLSCTHPAPVFVNTSNYPDAVGKIMETKCATAGCHNAASYVNADDLRLDDWDYLFNGGSSGAAVVPFNTENSPLLYFINTDSTQGPVSVPTMPYLTTPLSEEEYITIRNWIAAGAPDKNGNIAFADNAATRQKIYITQQGCDIIAVVDPIRNVVMRQIPIGKTSAIESPHCVRFSATGDYAYVSFLGGTIVQKIDAIRDTVVNEVDVGTGQWNILHVSPDGTQLLAADFLNGVIKLIRTSDMQVIQQYAGAGLFSNPHGIAGNPSFDTFYVTSQFGNVVYKFSKSGLYYQQLTINGAAPDFTSNTLDPHEIMMSPDHNKYFLSCQASNEIRVMDAHADTLIKVIAVGIKPQEFAISHTMPYLFVTCMEDVNAQPQYKGSVYVINYNTLEIVQRLDGPFYQPHGLSVDDVNGLMYVASSNQSTTGPAPHHASACAGRNGWYTAYRISDLTQVGNKKNEISVYPYSVDTRFKP